MQQGESVFPIERRRFVYVGSADYGKIADRVRFAGAMVLDPAIDITKPFDILYISDSILYRNNLFTFDTN